MIFSSTECEYSTFVCLLDSMRNVWTVVSLHYLTAVSCFSTLVSDWKNDAFLVDLWWIIHNRCLVLINRYFLKLTVTIFLIITGPKKYKKGSVLAVCVRRCWFKWWRSSSTPRRSVVEQHVDGRWPHLPGTQRQTRAPLQHPRTRSADGRQSVSVSP